MRIYDISMSIHPEMMVYMNREQNRPKLETVKDYSTGNTYESTISINLHTGTHVDAPLHMIEGGDSIDKLNFSRLITKCKVLDFTNVSEQIDDTVLTGESIHAGDFLILKTRNSDNDHFKSNFIYLDQSGAEYLKQKKINGIGIDSLGIERNQPNHETHKILFTAGIVILEGLRLKDIEAGEYLLFAVPLKIINTEAAPVRAILIKETD